MLADLSALKGDVVNSIVLFGWELRPCGEGIRRCRVKLCTFFRINCYLVSCWWASDDIGVKYYRCFVTCGFASISLSLMRSTSWISRKLGRNERFWSGKGEVAVMLKSNVLNSMQNATPAAPFRILFCHLLLLFTTKILTITI